MGSICVAFCDAIPLSANTDLSPLAMSNVSRVDSAKLLGVHLRHDLNFSQHVESVVAICNQRLYLSAQLKKQGLGVSAMDYIFNAIVLN